MVGRPTPTGIVMAVEHLLERSNPFSSQAHGRDCLASTFPRRRVVVGMGQTVSQILDRAEFAFRSGPAALDQARLDENFPFVCELRRRDTVDLEAASLQFPPLLLDSLTPISEQDEPVVLWPIP